jgi:hypothetical protein
MSSWEVRQASMRMRTTKGAWRLANEENSTISQKSGCFIIGEEDRKVPGAKETSSYHSRRVDIWSQEVRIYQVSQLSFV